MGSNANRQKVWQALRLLVYGVLFGALASVLIASGSKNDLRFLESCGALSIFFAALFLPRRYALISISLLLVTLLLVPSSSFAVARIAIFGATLILLSSTEFFFPPFLCILLLWILLTLATVLLPEVGRTIGLVWDVRLWIQLKLEIVGVLFFGLLRFSPTLRRVFLIHDRLVDGRTFFVHIFSGTVLGCLILWILAIFRFTPLSMSGLSEELYAAGPTLILTAALILILPVIIGLIASVLVSSFATAMTKFTLQETPSLAKIPEPFPIAEFSRNAQLIAESVLKLRSDKRLAELRIKELIEATQQNEAEIQQRELESFNLLKLMEGAPWGSLSCTANGFVIAVSDKFCATIGVKREELIGKHFNSIGNTHPWQKDVTGFLTEVCRLALRAQEGTELRRYTPTVNNAYLELHALVTLSSALATNNIDSYQKSQSDVAVSLFVQRHPDLRSFQLELLHPSEFELLGTQAIERNKMVLENLSSVIAQCAIAIDYARRIAGPLETPPAGTAEVMMTVSEIERLSRLACDELRELETRTTAAFAGNEHINVTKWLYFGLNYLYELLGRADRPSVFAIEEGEEGRVPLTDKNPLEIDTFIFGSFNEMSRFVAYFLTFLKSILPRALEPTIAVGYEEITEQTAKFVPGSNPGRFAHIVLEHKGQSLTASMASPRFSHLNISATELTPEAAFTLLSLEIRRMGGFLTAQSTAAKGTLVTIYLPVSRRANANKEAASAATFTPRRPTSIMRKNSSAPPPLLEPGKLLLIGRENAWTASLREMLRLIGFEVSFCSVQEVVDLWLEDEGKQRGLSAIATEDVKPTTLSPDSPSPSRNQISSGNGSNGNKVKAVMIDIEHDTEEALQLLEFIARKVSSVPRFVVVHGPSPLIEELRLFHVIRGPFTTEELRDALQQGRQ